MSKGRDVYYRKAKELGLRARSAFKLLDVDRQFQIFEGVERAVDLCAAPGSWSQVLSRRLYEGKFASEDNRKGPCPVIAVDLQEMAPIKGVHIVQGDITTMDTTKTILNYFEGKKAELVVCDGAPDVTGIHDVDEYLQAQLLLAALNITTHLLKSQGTFVAKVFKGPCIQLLQMQLDIFFENVHLVKPKSSRQASAEHFIVCRKFRCPSGYKPRLFSAIPEDGMNDYFKEKKAPSNVKEKLTEFEKQVRQIIVPFLACGDLSGFDNQTFKTRTLSDSTKNREKMSPVTSRSVQPSQEQIHLLEDKKAEQTSKNISRSAESGAYFRCMSEDLK